MSDFSRRQFLTDSMLAAAVAATAGSAPKLFAATGETVTKSANDKLGVLVCGVHDRGTSHLGGFAGKTDTEVVAICDADKDVGEKRCDETAKKQGGRRPTFYQDIRKALEDKSVDCVSIAMPNHWHALAAIWAMKAGKDVYVEKPVCHNISEGQRMVETARKYNKICQTGTQCRSHKANLEAMEFLRSGKIGEIKVARGLVLQRSRFHRPKAGWYEVPANIDYDLWCGPAPNHDGKSPYPGSRKTHRCITIGTGCGKPETAISAIKASTKWTLPVGDWASTSSPMASSPMAAVSDTKMRAKRRTPKYACSITVQRHSSLKLRGLATDALKGAKVGNIFECADGYLVLTSYTSGKAFDKDGKLIKSFEGGGDHFGNFIKAVRSRKKEDLNADIQEGFLSSALCHLGNISYRLGSKMATKDVADRLKGVKMADDPQKTLDRTVEHLESNKVKLDDKTQFQCGEFLKFDPKAVSFSGNSKANDMLSREYRKGFEVPTASQV